MPQNCSVIGCKSKKGFHFPKKEDILELWKKAVNIKKVNKSAFVCYKYFTEDDIYKDELVKLNPLGMYRIYSLVKKLYELIQTIFTYRCTGEKIIKT